MNLLWGFLKKKLGNHFHNRRIKQCSKTTNNFSHRQHSMAHSWRISTAWISMKLVRLKHHHKKLGTAWENIWFFDKMWKVQACVPKNFEVKPQGAFWQKITAFQILLHTANCRWKVKITMLKYTKRKICSINNSFSNPCSTVGEVCNSCAVFSSYRTALILPGLMAIIVFGCR